MHTERTYCWSSKRSQRRIQRRKFLRAKIMEITVQPGNIIDCTTLSKKKKCWWKYMAANQFYYFLLNRSSRWRVVRGAVLHIWEQYSRLDLTQRNIERLEIRRKKILISSKEDSKLLSCGRLQGSHMLTPVQKENLLRLKASSFFRKRSFMNTGF